MEILVRNAEGNVPESERDYAAKKFGNLDKYFKKATKVEMVHSQVRDEHQLEVTVFADEFTVRGEERDKSLHACIDRVSHVLEKRLRRLKSKLIDVHRRKGNKDVPPALVEDRPGDESTDGRIVQRKTFENKPMSAEEAILEMELIGHDWFLFTNAETNAPSVIWKKSTGGYGLLEPEP